MSAGRIMLVALASMLAAQSVVEEEARALTSPTWPPPLPPPYAPRRASSCSWARPVSERDRERIEAARAKRERKNAKRLREARS